jgi:hypothetical protein
MVSLPGCKTMKLGFVPTVHVFLSVNYPELSSPGPGSRLNVIYLYFTVQSGSLCARWA